MNEELIKTFDELKARLNDLNDLRKKYLEELQKINSKAEPSRDDYKRKEIINNKIELINNKLKEIVPASKTLNEVLRALEDTDSILATTTKDTLQKALIRDLEEITKLNPEYDFTDEIKALITAVTNDEIDATVKNIQELLRADATVLFKDINDSLDELDRKTQKLDKNSKSTVAKIVGTVVLATSIIAAIAFARKNNDTRSNEDIVIETPAPTFDQTGDKEADLLMRATEVSGTGFFEDLYTSEIKELLRVIADKKMWATENAGYAQAFNTTFNRIVEKYLFDAITKEDIAKIDALKSLAKPNSDLDKFLETYANLLSKVLSEPNNDKAKDELTRFIAIFANSLNGFTNNESVMTDNKTFNEAAQVNDFYDWWFAYDSIIKPTYPMAFPKALEEIDGAIVEKMMYMTEDERNAYIEANGLSEYKDAIISQIRLYELQYLMESALVNHPSFCEIRNIEDAPELTLGGR